MEDKNLWGTQTKNVFLVTRRVMQYLCLERIFCGPAFLQYFCWETCFMPGNHCVMEVLVLLFQLFVRLFVLCVYFFVSVFLILLCLAWMLCHKLWEHARSYPQLLAGKVGAILWACIRRGRVHPVDYLIRDTGTCTSKVVCFYLLLLKKWIEIALNCCINTLKARHWNLPENWSSSIELITLIWSDQTTKLQIQI